ncbi:hypothetical protein A2415_02075 [candidate division WWE3 bacterium RIFOXYC1_FULL_39_7]|uniref:Uncharacterized protein n=1 Tax=candidate division WWE3 bacterium RIFOXYC1_FULL_39_7 TaxID=1802643 RepID=A0A1F4WH70_UNCKA|nr:MAG: hypothetical protein A2415_02075 [candidate division WWE3 bacterium RIFOXYC1_FULL_39_7]
MKSAGYYAKLISLILIIFGSSLLLTLQIAEPIKSQNYFSFSLDYAAKIVLLMVVNLYAFSLTIGAWGKWEQYLIIPLPVSVAIFMVIYTVDIFYAVVLAVLAALFMAFDIQKSTRIRELLTKFDPKIILRLSTSGLLFIFSTIGGALVILYAFVAPEYNVGKEISSIVEKPLKSLVETQLRSNLEEQLVPLNMSGGQNLDPEVESLLERFGLDINTADLSKSMDSKTITDNLIKNLDIKNIVEKEVNGFVSPYKNLVHPILAVLMFALFQFYAAISMFIYLVTIDGIFWLAKKSNFFKTEFEMVQKEILKF